MNPHRLCAVTFMNLNEEMPVTSITECWDLDCTQAHFVCPHGVGHHA